MRTAPELLRAYLDNFQSPAVAAALFASDGVLELPWIKARVQGPKAVEGLIASLLVKIPTFRFTSVKFWIETPDRTFAEYAVEAPLAATGKIHRLSYAGLLVAEHGKITLLREALDTLAASEAMKDA